MRPIVDLWWVAIAVAASGSAWAFNIDKVDELTRLEVGAFHSCAVQDDLSVKCWGSPRDGRLGDGRCDLSRNAPVRVQGLSRVTRLATGDSHSCAVVEGGSVLCWGLNRHGQLGNGRTATRCSPVSVVGLGGPAAAVSAGFSHSCAVLKTGRIQCWGNAAGGRLGNRLLSGYRVSPVNVEGITDAKAIVSGDAHTCAIIADGTVRCWGENFFDQLGNGGTESVGVAVPVVGLTGVTSLATGATHTCALLGATGQVRCWGYNGRGQMGDGTKSRHLVPGWASLLSPAASIGDGAAHSCALSLGGELSCWGSNVWLQLGNGPGPDMPLPVKVPSPDSWGLAWAVAGGEFHTCAAYRDGKIRCWGGNYFGQLGTGVVGGDSSTPVEVAL